MASFNEYAPITKLALRPAQNAFANQEKVDAQWQELNYYEKPSFDDAVNEYAFFHGVFKENNIEVTILPQDDELSMDAIYVRDAAIVSPHGLILCNMGKEARREEPKANAAVYEAAGFKVHGAIEGEGRLEGGDFIWIDERTCAVGHGYRTNAEGIRQLKSLLGPAIEVIVVPLPHYHGPDECFHLMSFISPLDKDLMLVYSPVMPVPFREALIARGISFVEVPEEEFDSMACNVLAYAPRKCLAVAENPETKKRMEAAGCHVTVYQGWEISRKGEGGPTCLTRPLERA